MGYELDQLWLVRLLLQRGIAAVYLIAFLAAFQQFPALLGERGLLPAPSFLRRVRFRAAPSLFHWRYSDALLRAVAGIGIALSAAALVGLTERGPIAVSIVCWLVLWALYLSIVNVGQTFYAFGWESMLLEAGFLAAFLGPSWSAPSAIPVLALRWMLFRVEFGAGLIKLRHDPCWRDLTCLYFHHETQPLPNPLSRAFHRLPRAAHRGGVLFSHAVQLAAPFGLFGPQPIAAAAGAFIIAHQLLLIVSGNYSWLNWLTVVLGFSAFGDGIARGLLPLGPETATPRPLAFDVLLYAFAAAIALLSVKPTLNLFSRRQLMNYSYNPLHLVNTYGAFGSVTRKRYEVVIEGCDDLHPGPDSPWREYEFKAKPGDPRRRPPQIAPYHLRLDWLLWFLPFSVEVAPDEVYVRGHERWFVELVRKLLQGDPATLRLLRRGGNPFPDAPPRVVRALFYAYRFTDPQEQRATGAWWVRTRVGEYLPAVTLSDLGGAGPAASGRAQIG